MGRVLIAWDALERVLLSAAARTVGGRAAAAWTAKRAKLVRRVRPLKLHELSFEFHPLRSTPMAFRPRRHLCTSGTLPRPLLGAQAPHSTSVCVAFTSILRLQCVWATTAQSVLIRDPARLRAAGYAAEV